MQWWNDFVDWLYSDGGWRVISTVIAPFLAIVVAGLIAAAIGRTSTSRVLSLNDRQQRAAAVTAMIGAARRAAVWNTLSASEQRHADHSALESDIRLRLLSVPGAGIASDWCAHEIAMMKKNAVSFSFQAEQSLMEFRNRLIDWHTKPSRAKKLFKNDLDSWAYDTSMADQDLVAQQQAWAAQQSATQAVPVASAARIDDTPAVQPAGDTRAPFAPAVPPTSATAPAVPPTTVTAPAAATPRSSAFDPIGTGSVLTPAQPFRRGSDSVTTAPSDDAAQTRGAAEDGQSVEAGTADARDTEQPQREEPSGESDSSDFPPPVSVSHVRERINPTLSDRDELR